MLGVLIFVGIVLAIAAAGYGAVVVCGRTDPLNVEDRLR